MNRFWRPLTLITLLLLVTACSATRPPFPADYSVDMPHDQFGEFVVDVYDSAELVLDARRAQEPAENLRLEGDVVAHPERSEIVVEWLGGACSHRPFINVKGGPTNLNIELVPDPTDIGLIVVGETCPAIGLYFGVVLTLAEPVEQANVSLIRGPEQTAR